MTLPENVQGLRILVVGETFLIAEAIRAQLESCGCKVVGPAAQVARAMELASDYALDGAVLDVNIDDDLSFPVAAALQERGVPVVFLTAYEDASLIPTELRSLPRLSKFSDYDELTAVLATNCCRREPRI